MISDLPKLYVPDGRPAWIHYLDYCAIRRMFESLTPENAYDAVELVRTRAGIELPDDFDTVRFNLWVLIRRGYWMPDLTDTQRETLGRLLSHTAPTDDDDDTPLAPEGSHRALHAFLTRELGERIPQTRGATYAVASTYMGSLQSATRLA